MAFINRVIVFFTTLVIVLSMGIAGCENPEDYFDKAVQAEKSKDYKNAFINYRKAAEQGLSKAQHKLGMMYYQGNCLLYTSDAADE